METELIELLHQRHQTARQANDCSNPPVDRNIKIQNCVEFQQQQKNYNYFKAIEKHRTKVANSHQTA